MVQVLASVPFADPAPPLLSNASAHPIVDAAAARAELVDHLTTGVDWVASINAMTAAGVDTFIEVGPGRVLTSIIKRVAPDARTIALDDKDAPDGLSPAAVEAALDVSASDQRSQDAMPTTASHHATP
jgi:[acyl-carrier-protein] S-malonyltransferase